MKQLLTLLLLAFATTAGAQNWCNEDSIPDAIYVDLNGCDAPPSLIDFRLNGDDERLLTAVRSNNNPFWRAEPYQASMKRKTLCTRLCGRASSCAAATPSVETEGSRKLCVARYRIRCDRQWWKLSFESRPAGTHILYTRAAASQQQPQTGRGEAPGNLCDLGFAEKVRVSIVFDDFLLPAGLFHYDLLNGAAGHSIVVTPRTLVAMATTVGGRPPNDIERRLLREQAAILPNEVKFRLER